MQRAQIKQKEIEFLFEQYKKHSHFFKRQTFIEEPCVLEEFGISIPNQENFPVGYLKLWPQDFIVEEILPEQPEQTSSANQGSTIYADLVKCGLSTIEAVGEIAKFLDCPKKQIQFAGIKDKNAITWQKISFRKVPLEKLKKINSAYFFLENFYSGKGVVEKASLWGNRFTILVRTNKHFKKEQFLKNLEKVEKQGFYNFYYLQRFGTPRLINFHWGLFILRGDYKKAVYSVLSSPGQRELDYFKKLRQEIKNNFGDWQKIEEILEPLPLIFHHELKIIRYLKENSNDFKGALQQIPDQITLWVFALSSWLFNNKISCCLKDNKEPPAMLPLFLTKEENYWLYYKNFLEKLKIFPPAFENLKPFPYIQLRKRLTDTKKKVKINKVEIIKQGVILDFTLAKGVYATTFLAHLFQLVSGLPLKDISDEPIDIKASLGKKPLDKILTRFEKALFPATKDIFEDLRGSDPSLRGKKQSD